MNTIKRDVYVLRNTIKIPIEVTQGTDMVPIEFAVRDYNIPVTAAAVAYSYNKKMKKPNSQLCDVKGNVISFTPGREFFEAGMNELQIRVINEDKALISFKEKVKCSDAMGFPDDEEEKQQTLIEQLMSNSGKETGERKKADEMERNERTAAIEKEKSERTQADATEKSERKAEIDVERKRIDNLAKLPAGSTTGDAELIDMRVGADGTTYDTAGEAVRQQVGSLKEAVDETAISVWAKQIPLSNVKLKNDSTAIENQTDRSITFSTPVEWSGIMKSVKVLKNTHYTIKFSCDYNARNGFCAVTNFNETKVLTTKNFEGGNVVVDFDSGDYNKITIRIGNRDTPNNRYTISDLYIIMDNADILMNNVTTLTDNYFQNNGWINYYNGVLKEKMDETGTWKYSDYIDITNTKIISVYSSQYYDNDGMNVSPLSFYNKDRVLIKAYTSTFTGKLGFELEKKDFPVGAMFARFTIQTGENNRVNLSKNILYDIKSLSDKADNKFTELKEKIERNIEKIINFRYLKKINLIGDSITQGVGAEIPEKSSYAGILRKMLFVENDGQLNYGFESFSPLAELSTIKSKMVEQVGYNGFSRKWDGNVCYGNDEFLATNIGSKFSIKIKKPFNYLRVSYKDGIEGKFTLSANNTVILSVKTTAGTETAKMSNAIDISRYPADQVYTFTLVSGSMTISGVELGYNTNYAVFNNYGRAGIKASHVSGELLEKECDGDLIIYALGTNGITQSDVDNVTSVLKDKNCYKVILDLAMKSTKEDTTKMSFYLKQIADNIGAIYIKIADYVPVDSNGIIDASYLIPDGVHPSELGHECIAEYIAKILNLSVKSKGLVDAIFTMW